MTKQGKKTKLCWNCEGVVDRHAENCLYCGVYLHPNQDEEEDEETPSPPYSPRSEEKAPPLPPYSGGEESNESREPESSPKVNSDVKTMVLPLLFLLIGATALVFSMLLLFFSKNGTLVMKWNASYWFVYLIFSLPLLFIGWRTLVSLDER